MRHRKVTAGKLGRSSAHRKSLMRNMATALFEYESIVTTKAKAKALRRYSEKIITLAKRGDPSAHRLVFKEIKRKDIVKKLFDSIKARFEDRPGGYTRIYHLYPRRGDNAEMVKIELVSETTTEKKKETKSKKGLKQKLLTKKKKEKTDAKPTAKTRKKEEPEAKKTTAKPKKKAKPKLKETPAKAKKTEEQEIQEPIAEAEKPEEQEVQEPTAKAGKKEEPTEEPEDQKAETSDSPDVNEDKKTD